MELCRARGRPSPGARLGTLVLFELVLTASTSAHAPGSRLRSVPVWRRVLGQSPRTPAPGSIPLPQPKGHCTRTPDPRADQMGGVDAPGHVGNRPADRHRAGPATSDTAAARCRPPPASRGSSVTAKICRNTNTDFRFCGAQNAQFCTAPQIRIEAVLTAQNGGTVRVYPSSSPLAILAAAEQTSGSTVYLCTRRG